MKAWQCTPKNQFYSTIVFAETRGKARAYASYCDGFEGTDFVDIEVRRLPKADCMCKGRTEMDWENNEDRLFLVKEYGYSCGEYYEESDCIECCAKEYCDKWLEREAFV